MSWWTFQKPIQVALEQCQSNWEIHRCTFVIKSNSHRFISAYLVLCAANTNHTGSSYNEHPVQSKASKESEPVECVPEVWSKADRCWTSIKTCYHNSICTAEKWSILYFNKRINLWWSLYTIALKKDPLFKIKPALANLTENPEQRSQNRQQTPHNEVKIDRKPCVKQLK